MRTNQKLKTGTIVEWVIVNKYGEFEDSVLTRMEARAVKNESNTSYPERAPFRIAKTTLTK